MKTLILVLNLAIIFISCDSATTSGLTGDGQRGTSASTGLPTRWGSTSVFPLNIQMSNDFDSTEITALSASANVWSDEHGNGANFFAQSATNISPKSTLGGYNDSVLGIYKVFDWPSDLPSGALAVTQIRGLQRSSYIQITHADILVNYDFFDFVTDGTWGYDLQTVMVHELGHFLGLDHAGSSTAQSVMFPSIGRFTINQTPRELDIETLSSAYGLSRSASNNRGISIGNTPEDEEGIPVTITYEMYPNNIEIVKINGVVYEGHNHEHAHTHK